ncbi:hypothetical protein SprV_0301349000 [Sparganum proliferum]
MIIQAIEEDVNEDLPDYVQLGDAAVIVAQLTVPFSLVEMHDGCVFEALRNISLTPHHLEEPRQMIHELGSTVHPFSRSEKLICDFASTSELKTPLETSISHHR